MACLPNPTHRANAVSARGKRAATLVHSLLLLCSRAHLDDAATAEIRMLAAQNMDWPGLLAAAVEHAIAPLVCHRLDNLAGDVLPSLWRGRFREAFARNLHRNLFLTSELFCVLAAFEARGVRVTPFKGPVLAALAYGDIALRQFADLDFIVPHCEIAEAHRALTCLGYRSELDGEDILKSSNSRQLTPGQFAYHREAGNLHLELHSEATLRYFPRPLDLESLLARRETVAVAGGEAFTFSAEDLVVLLSVHGAKHFWDQLNWLADVAALAESPKGLDWELAIERARFLGAERMVLLGAELVCVLLDVTLPKRIATHLDQDSEVRQLAEQVCRQFFAAGCSQRGVFSRFSFRVRMRGRMTQGLSYAVRLATAATEADRNESPLAARFENLYAVLRPLRLARLYGWRSRQSIETLASPQRRTKGGQRQGR